MGVAKLKKQDAGEETTPILRQYGAALLGLLLFALVVHDIFGTHGYLAMRRTEQEIKKVKSAISHLNKENIQLEQEVKELKSDPRKIEKIARDELGLAKPGEVELIVGVLSDLIGLKLALALTPGLALAAAVFFVLASRSYESDAAARSRAGGAPQAA